MDHSQEDKDGAQSSRANLLWARKTVYVHPSPFRKDNVPGYLAIATQNGPLRPQSPILLAFLPESLLKATDDDSEGKFISVESRLANDLEGVNAAGTIALEDSRETLEGVELDDKESLLISSPPPSSQYAFSVPIDRLGSFTVQPPTVSAWYGNITFTLTDGLSLPTLYFHDDESQSIQAGLERALRHPSGSFAGSDRASSTSGSSGVGSGRRAVSAGHAPSSSAAAKRSSPPHSPAATWGGEELIRQLRRFASILRSVTSPGLFLVNPNRQQIEAHATPVYDDDIFAPGSSSLANSLHGSLHQSADDAHSSSFPDDPFSNPSHIYRHSTILQSLPNSSAFSLQSHSDTARLDPLTHWATSTRTSLLTRFSHITQQARHATHAVLSHPLAKPYVPHLPMPVQSFAHAGPIPLGPREKEWGRIAGKAGLLNPEGDAEYDSARVYLAKWARLVAEEGERNRKREQMNLSLKQSIQGGGKSGSGSKGGEEPSGLNGGLYELLGRPGTNLPSRPNTTRISDPSNPITTVEWLSFFDAEGRLLLPPSVLRRRIFARGIADSSLAGTSLRSAVWPFLLGAVPWSSSAEEREALWNARASHYSSLKAIWKAREALRQEEDDDVGPGGQRKRAREEAREQRAIRASERESRAQRRKEQGSSDGTNQTTSAEASIQDQEAADALQDAEAERLARLEELELEQLAEQRHRIRVDCLRTDRNHPSFKDVELDAAEETRNEKAGETPTDSLTSGAVQPLPKKKVENPNIAKLADILMTYGIWEQGVLGSYVQGMSDLCSPIFVVCGGDEVQTFWCFVGLMQRMYSNFLSDQSGMKRQLLLLQQLISTMDAPLFEHFERVDALNLFFCFRWLLVCFKREFSFAEVLRLWEVIWAAEFDDAYTPTGQVNGDKNTASDVQPATSDKAAPAAKIPTDGSASAQPGAEGGDSPKGLSNQFQLFVALGILELNRDMLLRYLENFDEMLQYMNELSQHMDVEHVIVQAESLCLALQSLAAPPQTNTRGQPLPLNRSKSGRATSPIADLPIINSDLVALVTSSRSEASPPINPLP
ncbi:GTPase activating protein [Tilletia horrida]|uniref:GTPase activating protein n=1 Tax=Tilletia horrida TaxID=155126 RepID=A0AAN6GUS9_9BASI|nr:GTPase activating protein [Tilletia horrida]KAK0557442.1 GTPase activating protein [Tilletia horrida]KAK0569546.1 GTPase activating protein [Tilletia horrida]